MGEGSAILSAIAGAMPSEAKLIENVRYQLATTMNQVVTLGASIDIPHAQALLALAQAYETLRVAK